MCFLLLGRKKRKHNIPKLEVGCASFLSDPKKPEILFKACDLFGEPNHMYYWLVRLEPGYYG